jgi:beta-galactosidase
MLGVIGNKFSIGKETYEPFSAELHYFRIEKRYWSICFERIKRAGFRIISSAVPWNVHQNDSRYVDFGGVSDPRKDLIVFLELAREFGFKVILRPGPYLAGQLPNGGLPKFVFKDIKTLARNAAGDEIKLDDTYGIPGGYLPSYMSETFQFYLKNYFKAFIEITKNYVHPRGPIFMVELDFETSFGRMLEPGSADYNKSIISGLYPQFLEERYETIKKLNTRYKEKNSDFESVEPPREFSKLTLEKYPKVLDWFRFRESLLQTYINVLEDIFTSYTVEPLFFRSLYFKDGELLPAFNLVPDDRSPFLGSNVFPEGSYFDLVTKARFLKAEYGFAFATSFASGAAAQDPARERKIAPIRNNERRFYYAAAVGAGYKGLNHYMFVDRDHWHGAPLNEDGTVSDGYEVSAYFTNQIAAIGYEEMDAKPEIAVVGNRLYYWLRRTEAKKDFGYIPKLLDETTVGFCRDLMRMKIPFGVRENRQWETMNEYKLLIIPTTEVMAERDQEAIVELVKGGTSVILLGVMPRMDEDFKDCQVLANHFRIKTTVDYRIGSVTHKNGAFPAHLYGSIRSSDDGRVKKLIQSGTKVLGVCSSRFKGNLYLFAFDLASGGNHQKLAFVESILENEKITSSLYCSDPSVDVAFQMGPKKGLLTVAVPPPGELSDGFEGKAKEIILQADLRKLGLTSAKMKLTNLLSSEEDPNRVLKITAKELREGLPLTVDYPDGAIFLVEKR